MFRVDFCTAPKAKSAPQRCLPPGLVTLEVITHGVSTFPVQPFSQPRAAQSTRHFRGTMSHHHRWRARGWARGWVGGWAVELTTAHPWSSVGGWVVGCGADHSTPLANRFAAPGRKLCARTTTASRSSPRPSTYSTVSVLLHTVRLYACTRPPIRCRAAPRSLKGSVTVSGGGQSACAGKGRSVRQVVH